MFKKFHYDKSPKAIREWESLWQQTVGATTFQHPRYHSVIEQHTTCRLELIWNHDRSACLPICLKKIKFGVWRRDLGHQGKYGGALGNFELSDEWWQACLKYIDGGLLNPWQSHPRASKDLDFRQNETSIFRLNSETQSRKFKSLLRKAEDAQLKVHSVHFTDIAKDFEQIHLEQCKRWGVPYKEKELREAQFSLSGSETSVVVDRNGQPIHIEASMKSGNVLINCLVAQNSIGRNLGAGVALLNAHAKSLRNKTYVLDQGPSGGLHRVKHYKITIGGENLQLNEVRNERLIVKGRYAIGRARVKLLDSLRPNF